MKKNYQAPKMEIHKFKMDRAVMLTQSYTYSNTPQDDIEYE